MVSGLLFFYCLWYLNETSQICWTAKVTYIMKDRHSYLSSSWVIRPWLIWKMFLTCSSFTIWNIWMKLHRYVDHQRLHIVTKDVISLSISVLLLFRHYISHKITFGAPSSGGVLCGAFICFAIHLEEEERAVSFAFIVLRMSCCCRCSVNFCFEFILLSQIHFSVFDITLSQNDYSHCSIV